MIRSDFKKILRFQIKGKVYFNKPLKKYTSFRIGGPAEVWIEPADTEDLGRAVRLCNKFRVPILLLGSGSNLLVDDRGVKKAVIRLSSSFFKKIIFHRNKVFCGGGARLAGLLKFSIKKGLGGLEFLAGVPGTVGGALRMNAGSPTQAIGNFVDEVKAMDRRGREVNIKKEKLKFGYRKSNLHDKIIILEAAFLLKKDKPQVLKDNFDNFLRRKLETQDVSRPSAGCVFRNPMSQGISSGRLIELAGLKGRKIGGAQISNIHANYIVNLGRANFRDVKGLIRLVQREIKKRYGLCLEPEIKIIS